MSRIKLIHHINVPISDRERTREWYEKVLGAEFLDRGAASNKRQLQLRLGTGEIHFTETPRPTPTASSHFALEIDDWDGMARSTRRALASSTCGRRRRALPPTWAGWTRIRDAGSIAASTTRTSTIPTAT